MATKCVLNVDLAGVYDKDGHGRNLLTTLAWRDDVDVLEVTTRYLRINTVHFETKADGSILPVSTKAFIVPSASAKKSDGAKLTPADIVIPKQKNAVLKVNFVDVQQGDGAVIESPDGRTILVDGGDNQLFARYLAGRFRGTSISNPK